MKGRAFLVIGGVLMGLLGIVRGGGGLILIVQGAATDPKIKASESATIAVGAFLLVLGIALVVAAFGVLRRRPWALLAGIALTIAFVVDGAINGYVLFGRPGDQGTLMNVIAAVLILVFLVIGRSELKRRAIRDN